LTTEVQQDILGSNGISREVMELSRRKVSVTSEVKGQMSDTEIKFMAGLIFGMAVYIYILMFGVRVMKSVQEEKATRIVEVIVSSVRPFQLMIGKIIAVALVALTQFTVWIILSMLIVVPIMNTIDDARLDHMKLQNATAGTAVSVSGSNTGALTDIALNENTQETMEKLMSVPWNNLIPAFVFFFIFGYLMYASIFAALGSAADTESDTAQFSVPVTIPLIIAMASFSVIVNDPDGTVAKWLSMIPFTSPIVMLMRIPFGGVYMSELLLSMGILMASFFFMTWLAGRIYRVGILMYGKKVSWRELGKWIFYKG
jgi:ABC-2 type transport system permease protein